MAICMKLKKCRVCKSEFTPARPLQSVCSPECALTNAKAARSKAERIEAQESRKTIRLQKEKLKTPSQKHRELVQQAEKAVRDYRRNYELQKGSGCMSCGRSQRDVIGTDGWKHGGAFDAGHYHGKGARPNLRLEPDNIWLQCKSCNGGSAKYARKGATVAKQFRENLIKAIGIDRVEELDSDDKARHWTEEELLEIKSTYKQKLKELKRVQ